MSDAQRVFHELNRQYFNGQLPEYRIVLSEAVNSGCGRCYKEKREIHLNTTQAGNELTEVLLHEMAHAAVSEDGHKGAWLAEMQRLADMGAPTRADWKDFQDEMKTITEETMESDVYDMGGQWDVNWAEARPIIGLEYGLTDAHGRSESKAAAKLMQKLRKQFYKGRRECAP